MNEILTQARLKETIHYNPESGVFTWLTRPGDTHGDKSFNGRNAGKTAGSLNKSTGYWIITVDSENYLAHRSAWMYIHGEWPEDQLDHINHERLDNRLINLREVTHLVNHMNKSEYKNNTSGVTGVSWNKRDEKWQAHIKTEGKHKNVGTFKVFEDAVLARQAAEVHHGFHANHGL
tara:strand:+ start:393 stop:920 length:528 start_codon:yes stop_codon:yes gene_type:complete